jgi:carbamoyl-phosphate synthase small subunit
MKDAILMLENGQVFKGINFGAEGQTTGEVVFNTCMMGYQEILTDPSYSQQIVNMTYTQIGNYGFNYDDVESDKIHVAGFISREFFSYYSNWQAKGSLENYMKDNNIIGIEGIDTRKLTRDIRAEGAVKGIISTENFNTKYLKETIDRHPDMLGRDLVKSVTCKKSYIYNENKKDIKYSIVAYDYGMKLNILRCLDNAGFKVTVVPADTPADEVAGLQPDGVFLSNGPGDPAAVDYAIKIISELIGRFPIFGICLGHQLMAIALGAVTYKLKFGHHGGNHPVKNLLTQRVEITSQNHGFSVAPQSLKNIKKATPKITHINLNDNTIEGIQYPEIYSYSVQHHPEVSPGPLDSRYIFESFLG